MALSTVLNFLKRGTSATDVRAEASSRGAGFYQKDLPDYTELVRQNAVWRVAQTTAAAALIGATYPTTACQLALYNNESEGSGKSYVIIAVTCDQIGAGAALASWHVIFGVSQIKQTTLPTANLLAAGIRPMKGNGGAYPGRALVDEAPVLDVNPLYAALSNSVSNPVASLAGPGVHVRVDGLIILPPSSLLALHVVAADIGVTTLLGIIWAELDLS